VIPADLLGPAAALGASLTWALGVAFYSALGERYAPATINFTRAAFALPFFLVWAFAAEGLGAFAAFEAVGWGRVAWFCLSMTASFAFGDALFLWSTQSLGPAGALAIASIYPLWPALAGWVMRGESLSGVSIAGFFVILAGTVLVILSPARRVASRADAHPQAGAARVSAPAWAVGKTAGVLLALGTSLCWGLNAWTVSKAGAGLTVPVANVVRMGVAALLCPLIGLVMSPGARLALPWPDLRRLLWVFVLEGFLGTVFYFYGITNSKLAVGAVLTSVAPVVVVPVALALGREKFSLKRSLGVLAVFVGICLLLGGSAPQPG
jgi:drug/metabolite transporter (DMT)-like permease